MVTLGLEHYGSTSGLYNEPEQEQAACIAWYKERERRKPKPKPKRGHR